jgi:hypothetical protein
MNDPSFPTMYSAPYENKRTTKNIVTKMVDIKFGNLLVEKYVKGGIIDSATRISVPHPVWFVKTYSH